MDRFSTLPDLASRALGGSVVFANDELFAEKENLIKPEAPEFAPGDFGLKGKVYDGWETRRLREPGNDHAIVRLGSPGIVHGVVIDTAYFRGNYPPQVSVEATAADGYPAPAELAGLRWHTLVGRTGALGDTANRYAVADRRRWTHVRLSIYPDGGVARFRVHGQVVPDPAFMTGTIDLAALENGGRLAGLLRCLLLLGRKPDHARPGPGHERRLGERAPPRSGPRLRDLPARRRRSAPLRGSRHLVLRRQRSRLDQAVGCRPARDWIQPREPPPGRTAAEPTGRDTAKPTGRTAAEPTAGTPPSPLAGIPASPAGLAWREILPQTRVQPDTRHRFRIHSRPPLLTSGLT